MLPQRLGQELIGRNNPRDAPTVRITAIPVAPSDENRSQICCEFTSTDDGSEKEVAATRHGQERLDGPK